MSLKRVLRQFLQPMVATDIAPQDSERLLAPWARIMEQCPDLMP